MKNLHLGLYPIVHSSQLVQEFCAYGVKTIQIRIKNKPFADIKSEIKHSITLAKQYQTQLFINDYWELAIEYGAFGVHLGQEDLIMANCQLILDSGLKLGISTHSQAEITLASSLNPSYLAFGPIYPTKTKKLASPPQGESALRDLCTSSKYPVIAIGGINLNNLPKILACGAAGVAVISALVNAENPQDEIVKWQNIFDNSIIQS